MITFTGLRNKKTIQRKLNAAVLMAFLFSIWSCCTIFADVKGVDSGKKKADTDYTVAVEKAYVKDGKKTVFLTFDDGPSKNTSKILDILAKNNVKATFFILGQCAETYPEIVKRQLKEGHALGNHSYSHIYKQVYANKKSFKNELKRTDQVLKRILGQEFSTRLFRFPGGSSGSQKQPMKEVLKENGYQYIDWNALNGDAESKNPSVNRLMSRLKETSRGKEKVVVLMHDADNKQATLQSLPEAIKYFKSQGYEFKILK